MRIAGSKVQTLPDTMRGLTAGDGRGWGSPRLGGGTSEKSARQELDCMGRVSQLSSVSEHAPVLLTHVRTQHQQVHK